MIRSENKNIKAARGSVNIFEYIYIQIQLHQFEIILNNVHYLQ